MSRKVTLACNPLYIPSLLKRLESYQYISAPGIGPLTTFPSPLKSSDGWEATPNLPSEQIGIWSSTLFKIQFLPMEGKFHAVSETKDLAHNKKHAQTLVSVLHESPSPLTTHRLDSFCPSLKSADVVSQIGWLYSYLPFGKKCIIY